MPAIYLLGVSRLVQRLGPLYQALSPFDYDAAYTYLISSVSLTLGDVPNYADHPGTLNHILLAFTLRLFPFLSGHSAGAIGDCESTACLALAEPEAILNLAGAFALSFFCLSIFFMGWTFVHTRTTSLGLACCSQSVFLAVPNLLPFAKIINGETVGIPCFLMAASLVLLTNFRTYQIENSSGQLRLQIVGGVLSGLFMSFVLLAKLSFLPVAIVLALHKRCTAFLASLTALIAGFYFWGIYYTNWDGFKKYWLEISRHTGSYGGGSEGFIDLHQTVINMGTIVKVYPVLPSVILILVVAVILLVAFCVHEAARTQALIRGLIGFLAVCLTLYGLAFATSNFRSALYCFTGLLLVLIREWTNPHRNPFMGQKGQSIRIQSSLNPNLSLESLLLISVTQILAILSVLKHFDSRYLAVPIAVSCISIGLALGAMQSVPFYADRRLISTKAPVTGFSMLLILVILFQGVFQAELLNRQMAEHQGKLAHDMLLIARLQQQFPHYVPVAEYRIKGIKDYAFAFAFIMGTTPPKAKRIMAATANPNQRFWIWLNRDAKFWNQIDGKIPPSQFLKQASRHGETIIFAIPDDVTPPPIPSQPLTKLKQNASLSLFGQPQ